VLEHATQVNDHLLVDVLVVRTREALGLLPDGHPELAVVLLLDGSDGLEQGERVVPAHVVAGGVLEDRSQRVTVMVVQVDHGRLSVVEVDQESRCRFSAQRVLSRILDR